jgi:hypothetical protein
MLDHTLTPMRRHGKRLMISSILLTFVKGIAQRSMHGQVTASGVLPNSREISLRSMYVDGKCDLQDPGLPGSCRRDD